MEKQPTCKQRIRTHWNGRKSDLNAYMNDAEIYENGNDDITFQLARSKTNARASGAISFRLEGQATNCGSTATRAATSTRWNTGSLIGSTARESMLLAKRVCNGW